MTAVKENVNAFNKDVAEHDGYLYSINPPYSSIVANERINDEILTAINYNFKTVIDVGCGDGTYTKELKRRLPEQEFTAFDPASNAIERASRKYPDITFFVGNVLDPSTFPNQKYDLAMIRGVLHHLTDPKTALANSGMLSDNILIVEPNGNNPILKLIEKYSDYHKKHEEQSFSSSALKKWCDESGFRIKKLSYIGFVPFFFPTPFAKLIHFFQPLLEQIFLLKKYFAAQIVILCEKVYTTTEK